VIADILAVFNRADVQTIRSFLILLDRNGISQAEAMAAIDGYLGQLHTRSQVGLTLSRGRSVEVCPSCGKGVVTRWAQISLQAGADVYGCRSCQWSEIR
jgi:predicted RNA-binding Zn-ribbon protein involved in translation (DUF1610 family)